MFPSEGGSGPFGFPGGGPDDSDDDESGGVDVASLCLDAGAELDEELDADRLSGASDGGGVSFSSMR